MKNTYVSLFSGAGIGCFGFKEHKFDCIATNEFLKKRTEIQVHNKKCKYESGYITGDITQKKTKDNIFKEIEMWKKIEGIKNVDVVIATPPCQGMSVANLKKNKGDLKRNSLVLEALRMIESISPNFFILENVASFLKTACMFDDDTVLTIEEAISKILSKNYDIESIVENFKYFGANSSRTRTLVIGVKKTLKNVVSPIELFPDVTSEIKTLKTLIGKFKPLYNMEEYDSNDLLHRFRKYKPEMREWISDLKEGESAFQNVSVNKVPHKVINNEIIFNKNKNGDKYKRQVWNSVAPCVHTRNDILASQNTIHPVDDRVFSISELMVMMNIPKEFKWVNYDLNNYNIFEFYKENELNIRQTIGEAVPTNIFSQIAKKISKTLNGLKFEDKQIKKIVDEKKLYIEVNLKKYIDENINHFLLSKIIRVVEIANPNRTVSSAFFTNQKTISKIICEIPDIKGKSVSILEPSCGAGAFMQQLFVKFIKKDFVKLILNDYDVFVINVLKHIISKIKIPYNFELEFKNANFLLEDFDEVDLIIGNPPFGNRTNKTYLFFLEKAIAMNCFVSFVLPKYFLNSPKDINLRDQLSSKKIMSIIDFENKAFNDAKIETINLIFDSQNNNKNNVNVVSQNKKEKKLQAYICDKKFPNWLIYRDCQFDNIYKSLDIDFFNYYRDRKITKAHIVNQKTGIEIVKGRNVFNGYLKKEQQSYLKFEYIKNYVFPYNKSIQYYVIPNMTYIHRCAPLNKLQMPDGSCAIIWSKTNRVLSTSEIEFISSEEFNFYLKISRNCSKRTINIDKVSIYYYGVKKND